MITKLLPLQGLPDQMAPGVGASPVPLVTAATWHVTSMIDRLRDALTHLMGQPDWDATLSIWTKDRLRILADLFKQRAALDPPVDTKARRTTAPRRRAPTRSPARRGAPWIATTATT